MKRWALYLWLTAALLLPARAPWAVETPGLYEAEVAVADQSAAARAGAARAALAEVLLKVTGNPAASAQPQLKALLPQAEQWMQRYQYRSGEAGPSIVVSFDRQTINQRIYDAGLPVWDRNRPKLLLWLALEDAGSRALVGGDSRPDVQALVNDSAQRRGLPLSLPALDAQDQNAVSLADVWGQFTDPVARVSGRYQADGVLLGRVYLVGPQRWRGRWTLRHAGNTSSWEAGEGSVADVITAGLNQVTEDLARRYALVLTPGVNSAATLVVDNVAGVQDYARVLRYLTGLDPVGGVTVQRVQGGSVVYQVQVRGELQGLTQSLALGRVLAPLAGAPGEPGGSGELQYRLVP